MRPETGTDQMLELVLGLPDQLERGADLARAVALGRRRRVDSVLVAGMGGSGIGGRIARGLLLDSCPVPFQVCSDYHLPAVAGRKSLVVIVSFSGNTEETLSAYGQAHRRGCSMVAITGGGELGRLAARHGVPVVTVPGGMPPRAALGYLFSALLETLVRLGICTSQQSGLEEAIRLMRRQRRSWHSRARTIARQLKGSLPMVYSTSRMLDPVADRWRCQLNENSGVLCHTNALPEHNHNEIVGMGRPARVGRLGVVIALLDRETDPRTRFRLKAMLDITLGAYRSAVLFDTEGRSRLARVFSLVMLGDLVSVELARLLNKDAMEIGRINRLKETMAGRKR